jgi:hypothetical protein
MNNSSIKTLMYYNKRKKQMTLTSGNHKQNKLTYYSSETAQYNKNNFKAHVEVEKRLWVDEVTRWANQNIFSGLTETLNFEDPSSGLYAITVTFDHEVKAGPERVKAARKSLARFRRSLDALLEISKRKAANYKKTKMFAFIDADGTKSGFYVEPSEIMKDPHFHGVIIVHEEALQKFVSAFPDLESLGETTLDWHYAPAIRKVHIRKISTKFGYLKWLCYSMKFQIPSAISDPEYHYEPYIFPQFRMSAKKVLETGPGTKKLRSKTRHPQPQKPGNSRKTSIPFNRQI